MRGLPLLLSLFTLSLAADDAALRRKIEGSLVPAVPIEGLRGPSLEERMRELGVPALSYAIVDGGRVVTAVAHGIADRESGRPASPETLFQAASISKPVTAMAVLDLVERGTLRLDEPVNSILTTWKLPENELTAKTPVTLRLLLSHSAGTTVHGFPGYARDEAQPTVAQILSGQPPANTKPVVVDLAPDTKFRYSGGGTTITQAVLVDRTGLPFPTLMRRTILDPLGMRASTYEQPLPSARHRSAATAYDLGGREVDGKWHVYPEMAAAGLWTTPSELARVVIEMQNALAGRPTRVLSIDAVRHMLRARFDSGPGEGMGLGFGVLDRSGHSYFAHSGSNEGYRATLIGSMEGGRGLVVMTNSDNGGRLMMQLLNTVGAAYEWPGYSQTPLATRAVTDTEIAQLEGRYRLPSGEVVAIRRSGESFEVLDLTAGWQKLHPVEGGTFARADRAIRYRLEGSGLAVIDNPAAPKPNVREGARLDAKEPMTAEELLSAGRIDEARSAYREQFRSAPDKYKQPALSRTAYGYFFAGRREQGVTLLELSTELHPTSAEAWHDLGEGLLLAGQDGRARAAFEEALRRIDADAEVTAERREVLRKSVLKRLSKPR
jgi:CubicO group peptidase (beta-lactamase class C family)